MKKLLLCLFIVLMLLRASTAQQLQLTNYTPQQGAPVYGANRIFQDNQGWLWFTSGYEVMRYDGHRFKTYQLAAGVKMDFCYQAFEVNNRKSKEIWIKAFPSMLKVEGDSLVTLDLGNHPEIINHVLHKDESWFLCTNGLYKINEGRLDPFITGPFIIRNRESLIVFNDSLLVSLQHGKSFLAFDIKNKLYYSSPVLITDIQQSEKKDIFFLVKARGIMRLKNIHISGIVLNVDAEPVFLFEGNHQYEHFVVDGEGNFWTYESFRQLVKFTPGHGVKTYSDVDGLPSLWFNHLFVDREQNIWIGFNSGLSKIRNTNWERYTTDESLYSNHITFFEKGPAPGQVFVGTPNGLNFFDNGQIKKMLYREQVFRCELIKTVGELQYFVRDSILFSMQFDPGFSTITRVSKLAHLPALPQQMLPDDAGRLFIPTSHGIFVFANQKLTRVTDDTAHFRNVWIDKRGLFWAGKFAGSLQCYRIRVKNNLTVLDKLFELDTVSPDLPRLAGIRALHEDKEGNIFVGTRYNGLFILTLKDNRLASVDHFGEKNGLSSNSIWGFAADTTGASWVANAKGLYRLQKINGDWKVKDEGRERQLYQATAIHSGEGNTTWVSSYPGVVIIRNDKSIFPTGFSVFITGINVNGEPVDPYVHKRFNYRQSNVSIDFSANSFRHEESVLYSWRLSDKDEWTIPASAHKVNYSALRPGKYRFSVKAVNAEGKWSANEESFRFEILPPFWQQAWFIVLVTLLFSTGLYILYRYRVSRLKELYEMRNRIARNLHDDIGATLSNIGILSELARRNMDNEEKANSYLSKAGEDIQDISESLSDIVWNINPKYDNLENLFIRMKRYAADMMDGKGIRSELIFPIDSDKIKPILDMDKRRDFYLIFKEAVNNLVKYSEAKNARVEVEFVDHSISLTVADDGKGFVPGTVEGNGLQNIRHRAERWNAPLLLESAPGKGTVIKMQMKLK